MFPPFLLFWHAALFCFVWFWRECKHQKIDRCRTNRVRFLAKMIIAPPPHCCDFTIDLQQCWLINRKIGDPQCTYYLIVRALTIADCCFFCSCHCWGAITQLIVAFFLLKPPLTCQFELSLPPPKNRSQQGGSNCKVSQQGGATTMLPNKGGATATPPNNRGKKEKRGEDDNKCRWWEEGYDGVAMDTIDNQLG